MLCVLSSSLNHCALHREKTKTTKEIVVFFFFSFSFIFGQSLVTFWRCSLSHRYRAIFDRCAGYEFVYSLTLWSCWLRPSTERNKAERILSTRESQTEEISEIMSKRNRRMFFSQDQSFSHHRFVLRSKRSYECGCAIHCSIHTNAFCQWISSLNSIRNNNLPAAFYPIYSFSPLFFWFVGLFCSALALATYNRYEMIVSVSLLSSTVYHRACANSNSCAVLRS